MCDFQASVLPHFLLDQSIVSKFHLASSPFLQIPAYTSKLGLLLNAVVFHCGRGVPWNVCPLVSVSKSDPSKAQDISSDKWPISRCRFWSLARSLYKTLELTSPGSRNSHLGVLGDVADLTDDSSPNLVHCPRLLIVAATSFSTYPVCYTWLPNHEKLFTSDTCTHTPYTHRVVNCCFTAK